MYEVSSKNKNYNYSYHPKSIEGILQRLEVLLNIYKGEIPLAREIGIEGSLIDRPSNTIKPILERRLKKQIKKYIPEISIKKIDFSEKDGKVEIKCTVEVEDE